MLDELDTIGATEELEEAGTYGIPTELDVLSWIGMIVEPGELEELEYTGAAELVDAGAGIELVVDTAAGTELVEGTGAGIELVDDARAGKELVDDTGAGTELVVTGAGAALERTIILPSEFALSVW